MILASLVLASALQQCLDWSRDFAPVGTDDTIWDLAVFDDGDGPDLYAGGHFTRAGGLVAQRFARWTGSAWQPVIPSSTGQVGDIFALAVYDDGSGPLLVAGGNFTTMAGVGAAGVAAWDGASWRAIGQGPGGQIRSLAVYDDGAGTSLYAGGSGVAGGIARWNGSDWTEVGTPLSLGNGHASRLLVFDDGSGSALYAAGTFTTAGGHPANGLARWDGASWSVWPGGVVGQIHALSSFDDGSGPALYAAGNFTSIGGVPAKDLARWNGSAWIAIDTMAPDFASITALGVAADGGGPRLVAGGPASSGNARRVWRWHGGASWTQSGGDFPADSTVEGAFCFETFDDGSGPRLFVGGKFTGSGAEGLGNFGLWNGSQWTSPQTNANGMNAAARAFAIHDEGTGERLWAAGLFTTAGAVHASRVARWGTEAWDSAETGVTPSIAANLFALAVATIDGSTNLYASGGQVWRRTGGLWQPIATSGAAVLCAYDPGGGEQLFAAGTFGTFGGTIVNSIVRWNGVSWSAVDNGVLGAVYALRVFDDGHGPKLYVGGTFQVAGSVTTSYLARWSSAGWQSIGNANGHVFSFGAWDDGGGPALYVGGAFSSIGGVAANRIAKWTAAGGWSALGSGLNGIPNAMLSFDDGAGSSLIVGGNFSQAGGTAARSLARWSGSSWSPLSSDGSTAAGNVRALAVFDAGDGRGPDLWVGGDFTGAGHAPSTYIARWEGCSGPGRMRCFGDGGSGPCPCSNQGSAGRGCDNSLLAGGAQLQAEGTTRPDTVVLHADGLLVSATAIVLQGSALVPALAFGDGLRCAGGTLLRLYVKTATQGSVTAPEPGDPPVSVRSAALGDPIAPGEHRVVQVYYRDPSEAHCPAPAGATWNVTNAFEVAW